MTISEILNGQMELINSSVKNSNSPTIFCFHCGNEIKESEIDSDLNCPICGNTAYNLDDEGKIIKDKFFDDNPEY